MISRHRTERRRAVLAAVLSLAGHAALLALLARSSVRVEPPRRAPLVVTLAAPERGAAAPSDGPRRAPSRDGQRTPASVAPPAGTGARATATRAPIANGAGAGQGEGVGDVLGTAAPSGPVDPLAPALPRLGEDQAAATSPPPGRGGLAAESDAEATARGKRRLDRWLSDLVAVDRARNGAESYWSGVRGALERGPAVDFEVLQQNGGQDDVVSGTRVGQLVAGWLEAAEAYARTGDPARGSRPTPGVADPEARLSLAARGLLDAARPENRLFVTELLTRVLVTVGDDGAVIGIALAEGSGNAAYDRLVLGRAGALRSPSLTLGVPPRGERRTLWTFRSRFELQPPVPVVGCGFDAAFRPTECFWPLKRSVHTDVRLEAVWDGGG